MADLSKIKLNGSIYNFKDAEARAILTDYSGMTDAEYQAGTSTANRLITPARLKAAILYYTPQPYDASTNPTGYLTISDLPIYDGTVI